MGPISAIFRCYANMLNFSGRARRAEYWWFALFQFLLGFAIQAGAMVMMGNPTLLAAWGAAGGGDQLVKGVTQDDVARLAGYVFAAYLILGWLPQLSVTIRRLHDTNRSGWVIFMPFLAGVVAVIASLGIGAVTGDPMAVAVVAGIVPLIASLWFVVVLCLPGTHGTNRYGPDPALGRRPRAFVHPAFAQPASPQQRAAKQAAHRAEIADYYRTRVVPNARKI